MKSFVHILSIAAILGCCLPGTVLAITPEVQKGIEELRNSNYKKATEILEPLSKKGDNEALYYLGQVQLEQGKTKQARKTLEQAAVKGKYLPAVFLLGKLLYEGKTLKQDKKKGLEYIKEAMEQGNSNALVFYYQINPSADTLKLVEKASTGDLYAKELLAQLYAGGDKYVKQDYEKALSLTQELIENDNNNPRYKIMLANLTSNDGQINEKFILGSDTAMDISDLFYEGTTNLKKSLPHSFQWAQIALEKSPIPRYKQVKRILDLIEKLKISENDIPIAIIEIFSATFFEGTPEIPIDLRKARKWTALAASRTIDNRYSTWLLALEEELEKNPDAESTFDQIRANTQPYIPDTVGASAQAISDYLYQLSDSDPYEVYIKTVETLISANKPEDLQKYIDRLFEMQKEMQIPDEKLPSEILTMLSDAYFEGLNNVKKDTTAAGKWTLLAYQTTPRTPDTVKYAQRLQALGIIPETLNQDQQEPLDQTTPQTPDRNPTPAEKQSDYYYNIIDGDPAPALKATHEVLLQENLPPNLLKYTSRLFELMAEMGLQNKDVPPAVAQKLSDIFYKGHANITANLDQAYEWTWFAFQKTQQPALKTRLETIKKQIQQQGKTIPDLQQPTNLASDIPPTARQKSDYYYGTVKKPDLAWEWTCQVILQDKPDPDLLKYTQRLFELMQTMQVPASKVPSKVALKLSDIFTNGSANVAANFLQAYEWTRIALQITKKPELEERLNALKKEMVKRNIAIPATPVEPTQMEQENIPSTAEGKSDYYFATDPSSEQSWLWTCNVITQEKAPVDMLKYTERLFKIMDDRQIPDKDIPLNVAAKLSRIFQSGLSNISANPVQAYEWTRVVVNQTNDKTYRQKLKQLEKTLKKQGIEIPEIRKVQPQPVQPAQPAQQEQPQQEQQVQPQAEQTLAQKQSDHYYNNITGDPAPALEWTIKVILEPTPPEDLIRYTGRLFELMDEMRITPAQLPVPLVEKLSDIFRFGSSNVDPNLTQAYNWTQAAIHRTNKQKYVKRLANIKEQMLEQQIPVPVQPAKALMPQGPTKAQEQSDRYAQTKGADPNQTLKWTIAVILQKAPNDNLEKYVKRLFELTKQLKIKDERLPASVAEKLSDVFTNGESNLKPDPQLAYKWTLLAYNLTQKQKYADRFKTLAQQVKPPKKETSGVPNLEELEKAAVELKQPNYQSLLKKNAILQEIEKQYPPRPFPKNYVPEPIKGLYPPLYPPFVDVSKLKLTPLQEKEQQAINGNQQAIDYLIDIFSKDINNKAQLAKAYIWIRLSYRPEYNQKKDSAVANLGFFWIRDCKKQIKRFTELMNIFAGYQNQ